MAAETGLQRGQQPDGHEPMAEERGKNLYDVLGLGENTGCSADELKRAYRKTALRTHPDKKHEEDASPGEEGRGGPEGQQNEAFLEVQRAWAILSDPEERYRYDEELLRGGAGDELEDVVPDKVVTLSEMSHDRGAGIVRVRVPLRGHLSHFRERKARERHERSSAVLQLLPGAVRQQRVREGKAKRGPPATTGLCAKL